MGLVGMCSAAGLELILTSDCNLMTQYLSALGCVGFLLTSDGYVDLIDPNTKLQCQTLFCFFN